MKKVRNSLILPVFILFIAGMLTALKIGVSMIVPLSAGLIMFSLLALSGGFKLKEILNMILASTKDSFIVVGILLLVGCLTGLWRASGTIAYFVTIGIRIMPKSLFFLAAFLLTTVMSFAFGTSFGVTATAGVILITIARTGGADPVLTAGAILSGVYVGAVFCNQTIGVIMLTQLSAGLYGDSSEECNRKMLDTENSVITVAGLIPWCIACSVPLSMLGATAASVPLAFYLWIVPLYNWILSFIAITGAEK